MNSHLNVGLGAGAPSHGTATIENEPTVDTRNVSLPSGKIGVPKPTEKRVNSIDNYILKLASQGKKTQPQTASSQPTDNTLALPPDFHEPQPQNNQKLRDKFQVDLTREDLSGQ
jgi:hypothetical protein